MPPVTLSSLLVYKAILESTNFIVTVFNRDLVVTEVSRAAAELVRRSRKQIVGESLRGSLPPEYIGYVERVLSGEVIETDDRVSEELNPDQPWTRVTLIPVRDGRRTVAGGMIVVEDVTKQRRTEELVEQLAFLNPLTQLPNRRMLSMVLTKALSGSRMKQRQLAVAWLNIDRFKDVTHALGREAGNQLLLELGKRLDEVVRMNDLVAHVGGDDFVLVLPRVNSLRHLEQLMGRIRGVFTVPFTVGEESVLVTASCDGAVHPSGEGDAHDLEERAHSAMRTAKDLGGGTWQLYEGELSEDSAQRLRLAREIRDGIDAGEFVLHYQPQIRLDTMEIQAVEALVRWEHPERGLLPPGEFIAFAEESAMIVPLGRHTSSKLATTTPAGMRALRLPRASRSTSPHARSSAATSAGRSASSRARPGSHLPPSRSRSPRPPCWPIPTALPRSLTVCAKPALRSPWTTSAPATRRSPICASCTWTGSRSTARSWPTASATARRPRSWSASPTSPTTSAWRSSPRAWRRKPSSTSCAPSAATRRRGSIWPGR
jgi:diguanylate cyclase (GGDEF)-like protein/PAS domain S-box-containing protein